MTVGNWIRGVGKIRPDSQSRFDDTDMPMSDLDDAFFGQSRHHTADGFECDAQVIGDVFPVHGEMDLVGGEASGPVSRKQVREEQEQTLMRGVPAEFAEMRMTATDHTACELVYSPLKAWMRLGDGEQMIDRDRADGGSLKRDGARAVLPAPETLEAGDLSRQGESDDLFGAGTINHAGTQCATAHDVHAPEQVSCVEDRTASGYGAASMSDSVDLADDFVGQVTRETRSAECTVETASFVRPSWNSTAIRHGEVAHARLAGAFKLFQRSSIDGGSPWHIHIPGTVISHGYDSVWNLLVPSGNSGNNPSENSPEGAIKAGIEHGHHVHATMWRSRYYSQRRGVADRYRTDGFRPVKV